MADITVLNNGPLRVKGDLKVTDAQGRAYDLKGRDTLSLCRCGHSDNKPFCDGAHNRNGFQHEAEAFELPEPKK